MRADPLVESVRRAPKHKSHGPLSHPGPFAG